MSERDGEFVCAACSTKLNSSDRNCWRCGSTNLKDMRNEGWEEVKVPSEPPKMVGFEPARPAMIGYGPPPGCVTLDVKFYRPEGR